MSPTFHSLRIRNYRLYAGGMAVGNIGTWMQRIAQDWLVLQLTGSGVALGITTGLQFLPMLLFSMFGGMIADRCPKQKVLIGTQAFMGLTALVLGVLVVTDLVQTWHVFLLAFLLGLGTSVDGPARQSFVLEMVGRDDLPNAVGLNSASFNAARIVGPALAGLLIASFGDRTGPVFLLNAVSFIAVIVALSRIRTEELEPAPLAGRGPGQLRAGVRYVFARRDLLCVLAIVFFAGTFGLNFQMTTALMATDVYDKGAGEYGLLGSILAVGSLTGALMSARRGAPRLRLLVLAGVAFGACTVLAGLMPNYWTFAIALIPVGFTALTLITSANATMQLGVDPVMRGRVMAFYMAVFFGGTPLGAPFIGWLAEAFGARWSLIGGGLIVILGVAGSALMLARKENLVIRNYLWRGRPAGVTRRTEDVVLTDTRQRA
jgi:MFS family permease